MKRYLWVLSLVGLLHACAEESASGGSGDINTLVLTADTLGTQTVLTNAEYLLRADYSQADLKRGELLSGQCLACHSLTLGGHNIVGPGLFGFFGKKTGQASGFDYSEALTDAKFVWTPRALDAWLQEPGRFLPGNRMAYTGLRNKADRDAVIAYLLAVTDDASSASSAE